MKQLDLFKPEPMIKGSTNASGKDVYYCRRRLVWTTDPEDLYLTDIQLYQKYGPESGLSWWQEFGVLLALGEEKNPPEGGPSAPEEREEPKPGVN